MVAIVDQPARARSQSTSASELPAIARFSVDLLDVLVFENRALAGRAAAQFVEQAIAARAGTAARTNIVFAAAPSQNEFLAGLVASKDIDWARVVAFHMDEYLGIDADHPASFRRYLQEHILRLVAVDASRARLIPGEQVERPLQTCLAYEDILRAEPPDIVCAGIGENGHLAFNDPPVADFLDPVLVKVVRLDAASRAQQLNDGCFETIADVPTHAYTLTIPALLRAPVISVVVPGPRKANAVLTTLRGPISEACPATALRRHPGARLYLDRDAARLVL
ncbi:MAG: 6-phosphogluconolactonase [Isosphaerales bacterium]